MFGCVCTIWGGGGAKATTTNDIKPMMGPLSSPLTSSNWSVCQELGSLGRISIDHDARKAARRLLCPPGGVSTERQEKQTDRMERQTGTFL